MSSKVEIWNMALRAVGVSTTIAEEDERSAEAAACRDVYDEVLTTMLSEFPWPFALRRTTLALVEERPVDEWGYAYRYPPEALAIWRLVSSYRPDTRLSRVPFEVVGDDAGQLIYTSQASAVVEYTVLVAEPERYPASFVSALKYRLGAEIAPSVTSGDQFKLGDKAMQKYLYQLDKARVSAARQSAPNVPPDAELVRARD